MTRREPCRVCAAKCERPLRRARPRRQDGARAPAARAVPHHGERDDEAEGEERPREEDGRVAQKSARRVQPCFPNFSLCRHCGNCRRAAYLRCSLRLQAHVLQVRFNIATMWFGSGRSQHSTSYLHLDADFCVLLLMQGGPS